MLEQAKVGEETVQTYTRVYPTRHPADDEGNTLENYEKISSDGEAIHFEFKRDKNKKIVSYNVVNWCGSRFNVDGKLKLGFRQPFDEKSVAALEALVKPLLP